ncbi:hypothetical protein HUU42_02825 [bacterium]|nr:hypothetical protein [bacterium]
MHIGKKIWFFLCLFAFITSGCDTEPSTGLHLYDWQRTAGPYKLNIHLWSMTITPEGHIYIGLSNEGSIVSTIYRSTDNGETWQPTGMSNNRTIHALAAKPGFVFAGASYGSTGVFRTSNGGLNWTPVGLFNSGVLSLMIAPNGDVYAGTETEGIHRSTDNGASWQQVHPAGTICSFTHHPNGDLFAGTHGDILRSTDGGDSWFTAANLPAIEVPSMLVDHSGNIFAGTIWGGVFISTDAGVTWNRTNDAQTGNNVWALGINSANTIFAGHYPDFVDNLEISGIFQSTNQGNSWMSINSNFNPALVNIIAVNSSDHIFAATLDIGVYRSTDGGSSWHESLGFYPIGEPNQTVSHVAIDSDGRIFAASPSDRVFSPSVFSVSVDNGHTWRTSYSTFDSLVDVAINNNNDIFLLSSNQLFRSSDHAFSWQVLQNGLALAYNAKKLRILTSQNLLLLADTILYASSDNGNSWNARPTQLHASLNDLVFDSDGNLYLATATGIYHSTDQAASWQLIDSWQSGLVKLLVIDQDDRLYAVNDHNVIYRANSKKTGWTDITNGINGFGIYCLQPVNGVLAAGTSAGIFVYNEEADFWDESNLGLVNRTALSMTVYDGQLVAGTAAGVFYGNRLRFSKLP